MMAGVLAMEPYSRTGSAVSTRVLSTSVSVYGKLQKNFGKSTNTIGKTRLMLMMMPSSSSTYGMTYAKGSAVVCFCDFQFGNSCGDLAGSVF